MKKELRTAGFSFALSGISLQDKVYAKETGARLPQLPYGWGTTNAGIADAAKLFDELRYPGVELADCAVDEGDTTWYLRCDASSDSSKLLMSAISASRYTDYPCDFGLQSEASLLPENLNSEQERVLLSCILLSPYPDKGFNYLKQTGFIEKYWPELYSLDDVDQSKEFHPEGNVWNHTMETFQHRKTPGKKGYDLSLSLGLLLHDTGKPIAASSGSKKFAGHAQLGEKMAYKFLHRLEYPSALIQDVCYLVRNHMMPAAMPRLPEFRFRQTIENPLFPLLMELYRCDESSSFKGLENYYESARYYQMWLRRRRNPWRG
jgi:poly(A) polymerase